MTTEVWFRNPLYYRDQIIEARAFNVVFHRGFTQKNTMAGVPEWMNVHMPVDVDWRALHLGYLGTAEYVPGCQFAGDAVAVYPTWVFGEDSWDLLMFMIEHPAGDDPEPYTPRLNNVRAKSALGHLVPKEGQEHRVVIENLPNPRVLAGKRIWVALAELQRDYPEVIFHLHGSYAFGPLFASGARSIDFDAFGMSKGGGGVILPNGRRVPRSRLSEHADWVNTLGFSVRDLEIPKNRCLYHIKAALWASANWGKPVAFRSQHDPEERVDTITPDAHWKPNVVKSLIRRRAGKALRGDMIACDVCSLADSCKAFRSESICTLPDSDGSKLAEHFGSTDIDVILNGMTELMVRNARRLDKAMDAEDARPAGELYDIDGDPVEIETGLDPEVTKILGTLFTQGEKIVRLRDPKRFRAPAIVNNNSNAVIGAGAPIPVGAAHTDAQVATADAIALLEAKGWKREDITRNIVDDVMAGGEVPSPILELTSSEVT